MTYEKELEAFSDKLFNAILATQQVQAAYIGDKLGWFKALAKHDGPMSSDELASNTECSERYAREWLEMMTVSGWIICDDPKAEPRRFRLPAAHAEVLANEESLNYMLPLAGFQVGVGKSVDAMAHAYKTDGGVSWNELGQRENQAAANRAFFLHALPDILKGIPEIEKSLGGGSGGKVADIGAGYAFSSIGTAQAFPECKVDAYDLDEPSIDQAKIEIEKYGLSDRVKARCTDAGKLDDLEEPYDLVMALECIHDMSDPISALKAMKKLAGETGFVMVVDEKVQEEFTGSTDNPVEALFYGYSCTCCLADSKSGGPNSAGTGTVMRTGVLKSYAQQAGFKTIEILPVENDLLRFYKLVY